MTAFRFHPPAKAINLNDRSHWSKNAALVREWRTAAWGYARQAKIGPQPPSLVTVTFPVKGRRRRDPHNWTPTVKAIVDGLVDAGVWPDDNSDWVATTEPALDPDTTEVEVRITPLSNGEVMASGEGYADRRDRDHAVNVLFPGVEIVEVEG